ncbi:tyrosine-type recombinase/integrase [Kushneria phosphatilytica]|uniref:Tyrosine-type recombinase/integrase n=1 Tax=Kushneria phosphatilytica TaxID=657387 RepID=A0A1S1P0U9_9GAMM|nr:tyrosine-type recombinase/integrase [Kushneria phosphatilytica]OHV12105.1 integrase [Kushneria phosphatilytica]QEL11302.1 tyrosine-type recombinase/integrase [Kushneria phosphatilytica]
MKRSEIRKRPLSDTTIAGLEPEEREYREHDGNGLYLRVNPTGYKTWMLRYKKPNGKWAWKTLGKYPALSAKDARRQALNGIEEKPDSILFRVAAEDWYQHKLDSGRAPSAVRQMRLYLDKDILPEIGDKPLDQVTRQDCVKVQGRLESRGARSIASKVRVWLNQIFSRSIAQGLCELNPASELNTVALPVDEKQYPHLLESELPEFLNALHASPCRTLAMTATWMLLRTASRPGMIRWAKWEDIDWEKELWTIPGERMKTRRDHLVPLPSQTLNDLRRLHERTGRSDYLFPGVGENPVMSDGTINKVIRTIGYKGKLVGHGSRHTASTLLHEHGWPHAHIEAQLAHKEKGVSGVYNKAAYLEDRRRMMQWYADYLDQLAESESVL